MRIRVSIAVVLGALAAAGAARADTVAFAGDGALPWTGGAATTTAFEGFAAGIAAEIAGRSVSVRCNGEHDWNVLVGQSAGERVTRLGFVRFWVTTRGGVAVGRPWPDDFMELAPAVCQSLQTFALASPKPTKCAVTRTVPKTVLTERRVRVQERRVVSVRVGGRSVRRTRVVTRWVTKRVAETVYEQVVDPAVACYANGRVLSPMTATYWSDYRWSALSMLTLAHEAIHLQGEPDEAVANCSGMQWVRHVAERLGAAPDDADAIAAYAWERIYPGYRGTEYWSAECRDGGRLDLHPETTRWP